MICVSATAINSFGLVLDIIGVVLLFFYGAKIGLWDYSPNSPNGKTSRLPVLGLSLLILGFGFQILSNWL